MPSVNELAQACRIAYLKQLLDILPDPEELASEGSDLFGDPDLISFIVHVRDFVPEIDWPFVLAGVFPLEDVVDYGTAKDIISNLDPVADSVPGRTNREETVCELANQLDNLADELDDKLTWNGDPDHTVSRRDDGRLVVQYVSHDQEVVEVFAL